MCREIHAEGAWETEARGSGWNGTQNHAVLKFLALISPCRTRQVGTKLYH